MTDILVIIDPNAESHPCLDRAVWLGKLYGAKLHLFICDYDPYLVGGRFGDSTGLKKARESLLRSRQQQLEKIANGLVGKGLSAVVDVSWYHPLDEGIVAKVLSLRPMMVVKDTHYHNALKRSVFSNTDWNLIRNCPAPLLLTKPRALGAPPKVIAAVDPVHEHDKPAQLDHDLITMARDIAHRAEGKLLVFHCFDPTPAIAGAATTVATPIAIPVSEITDRLQSRHQQAMDRLADDLALSPDEVRMHQGKPSELLPELADQEQADIVVMGAVSRSGLRRIFLGHTAERVLDGLPCDLLIVKPDDVRHSIETAWGDSGGPG